MLTLDLKVGESVAIGDTIVTLQQKSGQLARLHIQADKSVPVRRIQQSTGINEAAERGIAVSA